MAERPQLLPQLDPVVDLAVLHHPVATVLGRERLVAGDEIDDRKARVDHPETSVEIEAGAVGAAVSQLAGHGQKQPPRRPSGTRIGSRDTAHVDSA